LEGPARGTGIRLPISLNLELSRPSGQTSPTLGP
jgi:hypothetical protein